MFNFFGFKYPKNSPVKSPKKSRSRSSSKKKSPSRKSLSLKSLSSKRSPVQSPGSLSRSKSRSPSYKSLSQKRHKLIQAPKNEFELDTLGDDAVVHKVIGVGGLGCILAPALKLSPETDGSMEVTKIASDAYIEYDVAHAVYQGLLDKFPDQDPNDTGIFPVGPLKCGLGRRDLGVNFTNIQNACSDVLRGSNITSRRSDIKFHEIVKGGDSLSLSRNSSRGQLSKKREVYKVKSNVQNYMMKTEFCAFNIPRYWKDLSDIKKDLKYIFKKEEDGGLSINKEGLIVACKELLLLLVRLHMAGFLHLDIKPPNIAVVKNGENWWNLKFLLADWGYTISLKDEVALRKKVAQVALSQGRIYENEYYYNLTQYTKLYYNSDYKIPEEFTNFIKKTFDRYFRLRKVNNVSDNVIQLKTYDLLCMCGGPISMLLTTANFNNAEVAEVIKFVELYLPPITD